MQFNVPFSIREHMTYSLACSRPKNCCVCANSSIGCDICEECSETDDRHLKQRNKFCLILSAPTLRLSRQFLSTCIFCASFASTTEEHKHTHTHTHTHDHIQYLPIIQKAQCERIMHEHCDLAVSIPYSCFPLTRSMRIR